MDVFNDFIKETNVEEEIIQKYKDILPEEIIEVWEKFGFGSMMNGYLKLINPEDFQNLLIESYFRGNLSIPIFATSFGDIITWEENEYVGIVKYKSGTFNIILKKFKFFFKNMSDKGFLDDTFDIEKYDEAVKKYGKLNYDECFGYVPLLGLGGNEKVENIKKVKIIEHVELITQLVGRIQ